ncbi:Endonuclease/exonuclease/phosphatase [Phakopsora pachyrhizi]|nr:Endonuclease/exonuclease/phosphatase [Phakopsora pachyrhizi]
MSVLTCVFSFFFLFPFFFKKKGVITLEFDDFYLIGTYTPNAGEKLKFMEKKKEWNVWFEKYLRQLDEKKPIVWGGDINCALTSKDLRNPESNYNKSAGYTQDEIDGLMRQLNPEPDQSDEQKRLIDVWRHLNPDAEGYYTMLLYLSFLGAWVVQVF